MNMAPKHNPDAPNSSSSNANVEEADLQEISAVDTRIDELSSVLDQFEQQTDSIIEQLKELLHSNREIRQELALEKAAAEAERLKITDDDEKEEVNEAPEAEKSAL